MRLGSLRKERFTLRDDVLRVQHEAIVGNELFQECLAFFERRLAKIASIRVEQIEGNVCQLCVIVGISLQTFELCMAVLVERDDLAVDENRRTLECAGKIEIG